MNYKVIDEEKYCYINEVEKNEDGSYHLNYESEDNMKTHYIISGITFLGPVNILAKENTVVVFQNCKFYDQIYSMLTNELVFSDCKYSFDGMGLNYDYDEDMYFLRGTTKYLKFINNDFINEKGNKYNFSIDMCADKVKILNSVVDYNELILESSSIKITNSKLTSKSEEKMMIRPDKINTNKFKMDNSTLLTDEIDINSIDVILDESKIEARSKINIETCFLNDSSNIYSPKISINNNHLLEQENSYSELKNARINLIKSLNKMKKQYNDIVREKVKIYEKKLNNRGISTINKK